MTLRRFIILLAVLLPMLCMGQENPADSTEQMRQDSLAVTEADDFVTASLLVASPSDVLYSCVGHSSIRLQCPHYDLDMVYTYESESVAKKVLSFFMGKLKMGMMPVPTERVLADYASEGRGVTEYVINIPLEKRKQLWQYLDGKVAEGMNLPYDYLNRSCAHACLGAIRAAVLPDTISFGGWTERVVKKTRRTLLADRTDDFPWDRFIILTVAGTEADLLCALPNRVVIPMDLVEVLQKATFNGQPVLKEPRVLVRQTVEVEGPGLVTPMSIACLLMLLAVVSCFWLHRPLSLLLLLLQSAFGLAVTYLVVFSSLPATDFSWLIIPLNPLPLILWRWRSKWLLPFAAVCLVWSIAMLLHRDNPLVDQPYIVFVSALAVNYIGQWKHLHK